MKKIIVWLLFAFISVQAQAGSSSKPKLTEDNNLGIITEDIATGFFRTNRFVYGNNMEVMICHSYYMWDRAFKCENKDGKNMWKSLKGFVPPGKKYVGFKSITQGDTHHIEIYWK